MGRPYNGRHMYIVILAGGGGTRLWPLSTPERPKPFLPLLGSESLLEGTVRRLLDGPAAGGSALDLRETDITVVVARHYVPLVRACLPGVAVLEEPVGRNTAAAIAFATVALDRPDDEVMVVLPADQVIADEPAYRRVLRAAEQGIAREAFGIADPLATLGIEVSRAATEYGYLLPDERIVGPATSVAPTIEGLRAYPLRAFEEKPSQERAEVLLGVPGVAWNAGMFLWRRRAIRAALAAFAPDILDALQTAHAAGTIEAAYQTIRATSIDYAVLEPAAAAGRVVMGAMHVGWSDLGSWTALLEALGIGAGASGRVVQADEEAQAGPDDLVVRRIDGRLVHSIGPCRILASSPSALLTSARPAEAIVANLLERVTQQEMTS